MHQPVPSFFATGSHWSVWGIIKKWPVSTGRVHRSTGFQLPVDRFTFTTIEGKIHVCNGKGRKKTWYILHFRILRWLLSIMVSLQVKLNLSVLEDIDNDVELCMNLSKEESVIVLTGKKQATLVSLGCSDPTRCLDRL